MVKSSIHKLPAFTLTEMMVTMVVSSIVVLLSYTIYGMVQSYFNRMSENSGLYTERLGFRTMFSRDLDLADSLFLQANVVEVYHTDASIIWQFDEEKITRAKNDTIHDFDTSIPFMKYAELHAQDPMKARTTIWVGWTSIEDSTVYRFSKSYSIAQYINR